MERKVPKPCLISPFLHRRRAWLFKHRSGKPGHGIVPANIIKLFHALFVDPIVQIITQPSIYGVIVFMPLFVDPIVQIITQPSIYGVIVYFCNVMSH